MAARPVRHLEPCNLYPGSRSTITLSPAVDAIALSPNRSGPAGPRTSPQDKRRHPSSRESGPDKSLKQGAICQPVRAGYLQAAPLFGLFAGSRAIDLPRVGGAAWRGSPTRGGGAGGRPGRAGLGTQGKGLGAGTREPAAEWRARLGCHLPSCGAHWQRATSSCWLRETRQESRRLQAGPGARHLLGPCAAGLQLCSL